MIGSKAPKGEWQFTGWHMFFIMLAFFGVIITVNLTMAVLAGRSWTGLVVKNSYVASQQFNAELIEARRQAARGWQAKLVHDATGLSFELMDRTGQPVVLDDLIASVGRPAAEAFDQRVAMRPVGEGRYRGEVALGPGVWAIKILGGSGENRYRLDERIEVPVAAGKAATR